MISPYEFKTAPVLSAEDMALFRQNHHGPGCPLSLELAKLEVGGQGLVVNRSGKNLAATVTQYGRRHGKKFVVRTTGSTESTIYRVDL